MEETPPTTPPPAGAGDAQNVGFVDMAIARLQTAQGLHHLTEQLTAATIDTSVVHEQLPASATARPPADQPGVIVNVKLPVFVPLLQELAPRPAAPSRTAARKPCRSAATRAPDALAFRLFRTACIKHLLQRHPNMDGAALEQVVASTWLATPIAVKQRFAGAAAALSKAPSRSPPRVAGAVTVKRTARQHSLPTPDEPRLPPRLPSVGWSPSEAPTPSVRNSSSQPSSPSSLAPLPHSEADRSSSASSDRDSDPEYTTAAHVLDATTNRGVRIGDFLAMLDEVQLPPHYAEQLKARLGIS